MLSAYMHFVDGKFFFVDNLIRTRIKLTWEENINYRLGETYRFSFGLHECEEKS